MSNLLLGGQTASQSKKGRFVTSHHGMHLNEDCFRDQNSLVSPFLAYSFPISVQTWIPSVTLVDLAAGNGSLEHHGQIHFGSVVDCRFPSTTVWFKVGVTVPSMSGSFLQYRRTVYLPLGEFHICSTSKCHNHHANLAFPFLIVPVISLLQHITNIKK